MIVHIKCVKQTHILKLIRHVPVKSGR